MFRSTLLACAALIGGLSPAVVARCQWTVLRNAVDDYLYSLESSEIQDPYLASGVKYIENDRVISIKTGILSHPLKVDFTRTLFDQETCSTFSEIIVTDPNNPYVIGTRLSFNEIPDSALVTVAVVDSVVTTTGDWLFNATKTLQYTEAESWITLDESERDRALLRSAADAYLDLWGNPNAPVPWGYPCRRLEGSAYTGNGSATDTCAVGIPGGNQPPNTNRRYVIDENIGSINVLTTFGTMRNAPDSHTFRLEGGKLRYVHTMTVMRNLTRTA